MIIEIIYTQYVANITINFNFTNCKQYFYRKNIFLNFAEVINDNLTISPDEFNRSSERTQEEISE